MDSSVNDVRMRTLTTDADTEESRVANDRDDEVRSPEVPETSEMDEGVALPSGPPAEAPAGPPLAEPGIYWCEMEGGAGHHPLLGLIVEGENDFTTRTQPEERAALAALVANGTLEGPMEK